MCSRSFAALLVFKYFSFANFNFKIKYLRSKLLNKIPLGIIKFVNISTVDLLHTTVIQYTVIFHSLVRNFAVTSVCFSIKFSELL